MTIWIGSVILYTNYHVKLIMDTIIASLYRAWSSSSVSPLKCLSSLALLTYITTHWGCFRCQKWTLSSPTHHITSSILLLIILFIQITARIIFTVCIAATADDCVLKMLHLNQCSKLHLQPIPFHESDYSNQTRLGKQSLSQLIYFVFNISSK